MLLCKASTYIRRKKICAEKEQIKTLAENLCEKMLNKNASAQCSVLPKIKTRAENLCEKMSNKNASAQCSVLPKI